MKTVSVVAPGAILAAVLSVSLALAQSRAKGDEERTSQATAKGETQYSEASLKFDILEAQLQTLRKKMQLRAKQKAEQTKKWNEYYEKVKQDIQAWDNFVDSYRIE